MEKLSTGEHFGINKKKIYLKNIILNEASVAPEMIVPWHYHENPYFYYHLKGHFKEINKNSTINCSSGTLLFHNGQEPHFNANFTGQAEYFHIELEREWFLKYDLKSDIIEGDNHLSDPSLKNIFRKLYIESSINDIATQISVDGLLLQAFSSILRQPKYKKTKLPEWAKKANEIIHSERTENLSLDFIAKEAGVHPVYLSREFPKYFQNSFGEYVRNLKIERATILLRETKLTNIQIAFQCGFSDESHFIRSFKQKFGVTPYFFKKNRL